MLAFPSKSDHWRSTLAHCLGIGIFCLSWGLSAIPAEAKSIANKAHGHALQHKAKASSKKKYKSFHKEIPHTHQARKKAGLERAKRKAHLSKKHSLSSRGMSALHSSHLVLPAPHKEAPHKVAPHKSKTKLKVVAHVPHAGAAKHPAVMLAAAVRTQPPISPEVPGALGAVHYRIQQVGSYGCHVVDIDLNNPAIRITCARAEELGHTRMTFASMVRHHRPLAAITGTFFDVRSGSVICNLVQSGKLVTDGCHGNTLMVDKENRGHFMDTANRAGHEIDWSRSDFAVSCGPTLLRGGRVVLDPPSEWFHDPGLFRHASRCGMAFTNNNHLLLVTVNKGVTLGGFAYLMKNLGAHDAINLDGGSSTGLYVRGHYPSRPARSLTNVIMVTLRPEDPIPVELEMESSSSPDETAPANVEDYNGPLPSPEQTQVDLDKETAP